MNNDWEDDLYKDYHSNDDYKGVISFDTNTERYWCSMIIQIQSLMLLLNGITDKQTNSKTEKGGGGGDKTNRHSYQSHSWLVN